MGSTYEAVVHDLEENVKIPELPNDWPPDLEEGLNFFSDMIEESNKDSESCIDISPQTVPRVGELVWSNKIIGGLRFRYQSEIEKRSFSTLKGVNGLSPIIKVTTYEENSCIQISLVDCTEPHKYRHFYSFYEDSRMKKMENVVINNGVCYIQLLNKGVGDVIDIKLDFLGIRKIKQKEALPYIKSLYQNPDENFAKERFNVMKDAVMVQITMFPINNSKTMAAPLLHSDPIKSQTANENLNIKIQHIAPKNVMSCDEELIIILKKKVTAGRNIIAYLNSEDIPKDRRLLDLLDSDGQYFVFSLPKLQISQIWKAEVVMKNDDSEDIVPIFFHPSNQEIRKRKIESSKEVPLKRLNISNSQFVQIPQVETLRMDFEFDGDSGVSIMSQESFERREKIEFRKNIDYSDDDSDSQATESENESINNEQWDLDGISNKKRKGKNVTNTPIIISQKKRNQNKFEDNKDPTVTKVLKEIARIGHDFALSQKKTSAFDRIQRQLPVVFTLQDDVGDTPLNNAILKGNVKAARIILSILEEHDCLGSLNYVNTSGHTALILAPACDVPADFVRELIIKGCDLKARDDIQKSAVEYAIEYKNIDVLEVLLDFIKQSEYKELLTRVEYESPLHLAVKNNFAEAVDLLLGLKTHSLENNTFLVDVNEGTRMGDETALHLAIELRSDLSIIDMLLTRSDLDINKKNANGETACNIAEKYQLHNVIAKLKDNGAIAELVELADDEEDEENSLMSVDSPMALEKENIGQVIEKMKNLSLKGDVKSRVIHILKESSINQKEACRLVAPIFVHVAKSENDFATLLERFNCLPEKLIDLLENLQQIGRVDIINKIQQHINI